MRTYHGAGRKGWRYPLAAHPAQLERQRQLLEALDPEFASIFSAAIGAAKAWSSI
jgi:hypothetical protein